MSALAPRTDAMLKGMKNKSTRQLKAMAGVVCRQLENELAAMTLNYSNTRHQYDLRLEANDAAMKTCAALANENEKLKQAIRETLEENAHLADGDVCTLIKLKRAAAVSNAEVSEPGDRHAGNATGAQSPGSLRPKEGANSAFVRHHVEVERRKGNVIVFCDGYARVHRA